MLSADHNLALEILSLNIHSQEFLSACTKENGFVLELEEIVLQATYFNYNLSFCMWN